MAPTMKTATAACAVKVAVLGWTPRRHSVSAIVVANEASLIKSLSRSSVAEAMSLYRARAYSA
jgi:hypothetical protein